MERKADSKTDSKDVQIKKTNPEVDLFGSLPTMDRFVDRFFSDPFGPLFLPATMPSQPRSEIRETNEAYVLSADIPGIPKENVEISVNGNTLSVRAEARTESEKAGESRRSFQSFQQSFTLPSTVDTEGMEAHCEDGVLEILMPKKASSKAKKIAVETGKGSIWKRITSGKAAEGKSKSVN